MQRTEGVSFLHYCVTLRSGSQAVEEKEEKKDKNREEKQEEAGIAFQSLLHFLHIKSTEQGRRKCRN
jgi:hypothetical protein